MSTTCTYHCTSCGCHFHSLKAFDAHRQGDHASNDPELGRHCVHPLDLVDKEGAMRLEALTEYGVCNVYPPYPRDVTIWTHAGLAERRKALDALSGA